MFICNRHNDILRTANKAKCVLSSCSDFNEFLTQIVVIGHWWFDSSLAYSNYFRKLCVTSTAAAATVDCSDFGAKVQ